MIGLKRQLSETLLNARERTRHRRASLPAWRWHVRCVHRYAAEPKGSGVGRETKWREIFGQGFDPVFVFMFWCEVQPPDALFHEVFEFNDRWYAVQAVRLADYRRNMRRRSEKWGTVSIPAKSFTDVAQRLGAML